MVLVWVGEGQRRENGKRRTEDEKRRTEDEKRITDNEVLQGGRLMVRMSFGMVVTGSTNS